MVSIREYLFSRAGGGGGLDRSFYARRRKQVWRVTSLLKSPRKTGTQQHISHWLNQKQSIKIRSTRSSLINSFYLNPPSVSVNEYTWCNTNFICSCIVGSIVRLFYFIKSRPRLLSRGYNFCTFPPIVANISRGALVSLDTATVIDISLRKKLTYTIFFISDSVEIQQKGFAVISVVSCIGPKFAKAIIMIKKYSLLFPRIKTFYEPLVVQTSSR